ncbi:hypothetical protein DFH08DRAFT_416546, partial [Mycena albidolilacea]
MNQQRTSRKSQSDKSKNIQLNKGQACFNCRRRKVRCDGKKPICTPCSTFYGGGLHDCEYTDTGLAQSQVLEEKISIIESRIQELEKPNETGTSIGLHNPYRPIRSRGSLSPQLNEFTPDPSTSISQSNLILKSWTDFFHTITSNVLQYASQVGFFLNPQILEALLEDGAVPSQIACPALLSAIYLWGAHLSRSETMISEASLLSDALRNISGSLSNGRCPNAIMQTLQAEVLLAQYFFCNARILEGKYHASAAVSIALCSGFHKIRSADARNLANSNLTPAENPMEEGERINSFWAVLTLNNTWLAADGSPRDISYAVVDTPWPLDMHSYSQASRILPLHSSATVESFLSNFPDHGTSPIALHAKAAIVFEQASRLAARFTEDIAVRKSPNMFTAEFSHLDGVIESLKQALPPLEPNGSQLLPLVIHSLAQVATIQLHNPFCLKHDHSRSCAISAAMAVVEFVRQTNLGDVRYIDAIVGTLWMAACQVLITELSRAKYSPRAVHFHEAVETLLAAMSVFSRGCRMIKLQLETAQGNYA